MLRVLRCELPHGTLLRVLRWGLAHGSAVLCVLCLRMAGVGASDLQGGGQRAQPSRGTILC